MMTLLDAYTEQRALNNNYQDVAAWKLGGTNLASSSYFNSEHLFYGPLKNQQVFSCHNKEINTYAHLAELEITFRLNEKVVTDLFRDNPISSACDFISSVMPSVELPYSRHDLSKISLPELIKDNCAAGALIIGNEVKWDNSLMEQLDGCIKLLENNTSVTEGLYSNLLKSPVDLLTDFLKLAKTHNLPLKEGQLVATGGISPCVEVNAKKKYLADFGQFGSFSFVLV
ncbi:hypothetical protein [Pseudoalteromonas prydzensis]|uniref:hypothetical protein n=1 Tax=Pseudoalteromonas prydzensis TaxID=182141 RepID=UPI00370402F0